MKRFRWFLLGLPFLLSCQQAKTVLDVADKVCRVISLVDPAGTGATIQNVINVADTACEYVRIVYLAEDGSQIVQMVPKALVTREAMAYRRAQQLDP